MLPLLKTASLIYMNGIIYIIGANMEFKRRKTDEKYSQKISQAFENTEVESKYKRHTAQAQLFYLHVMVCLLDTYL